MAGYIWQYSSWPDFYWDESKVSKLLSEIHTLDGHLEGMLEALGIDFKMETVSEVLAEDLVRSHEIEGVSLDISRVHSSIVTHLGMDSTALPLADHYSNALVDILFDALKKKDEPITHEDLYLWHSALFPDGRSGIKKIAAGEYRRGEMQVVSGPMGKERVHYQAPPADRVYSMMDEYLAFLNREDMDPFLQSAVSHLYFVAIHPFEDGNGRLTRILSDMVLSRRRRSGFRAYSVSEEILRSRNQYYEMLEKTTTGSLDITDWMLWFLKTVKRAILNAEDKVRLVLAKARFWQKISNISLNERQVKVLNMLLEGFEGNLTSSKWARITKASSATALRDITDLVEKKILVSSEAGGRSTSYKLKEM